MDEDFNEEARQDVVVVVVPLPSQGHQNQLLHFSRLISTHGIPVYYVGSAVHNHQVKTRVHGWDDFSNTSNFHFHDFPTPLFDLNQNKLHVSPENIVSGHASNKFPLHLIESLFEVLVNLDEPISELLNSLSLVARRVVVVHDPLMAFVAKEASYIPNGESYCFNVCSAFGLLYFKWVSLGCPYSIPNIDTLHEYLTDDDHLSKMDGSFPDAFLALIASQLEFQQFDAGELHNTCYPLEGKFIDLLSQEPFLGENYRQWALGPLNAVELDSTENSDSRHECLVWLDSQPKDSVLYVAFGTTITLSREEINELAIGLQHSEQRFIWVLRETDQADGSADGSQVCNIELPEGYEERMEGIGMIVRDWAPQIEILAHPSTGGFLSHCGWNSCMESLTMGVPIAAWPMHSDQPWNTVLVTDVLKVGLVVREWESRNEVISSTMIENAVMKLMVSEDGHDMRQRAEQLGVDVRHSVKSEDGSSNAELNSFLAHISRP
ncbi:hypothetical protein MKW94_020432 [Papaver nudicaule]|uniref:Glycosyltransferase n=1 Tax=Papaver nudicaule TaxID=74823 RepID=A0AA41RZK4_PAPNU|nr:hypothetical protein [Papaver nudicaule]